MAGTREITIAPSRVTALAFAAIVGIVIWLVGPSSAGWLAAGGALAVVLLAGVSRDGQDSLYPAHLQLARFRRSEKPADILVVKLPPGRPAMRGSASRKRASAAYSVLRVTDGVAILPSLRWSGFCAVLESDARARVAIEHRLRDVCGSEVCLGWASFPKDGVTLESLIAAATDRLSDQGAPGHGKRGPDLRPRQQLAPRSLGADHALMKRAR